MVNPWGYGFILDAFGVANRSSVLRLIPSTKVNEKSVAAGQRENKKNKPISKLRVVK